MKSKVQPLKHKDTNLYFILTCFNRCLLSATLINSERERLSFLTKEQGFNTSTLSFQFFSCNVFSFFFFTFLEQVIHLLQTKYLLCQTILKNIQNKFQIVNEKAYSRLVIFCLLCWSGWAHWCGAGHHRLLLSFLWCIFPVNIHKQNNKQPGNTVLLWTFFFYHVALLEMNVYLFILYAAS